MYSAEPAAPRPRTRTRLPTRRRRLPLNAALCTALSITAAFGLSMDSEVFLLSAVGQSWLRDATPKDAVTRGVAGTGGVISAAAVIMIAGFLSFTFGPNPVVTAFGVELPSLSSSRPP